eukprot:1138037-Rhodomonas_salina.1
MVVHGFLRTHCTRVPRVPGYPGTPGRRRCTIGWSNISSFEAGVQLNTVASPNKPPPGLISGA